jgi:hypothetical protein
MLVADLPGGFRTDKICQVTHDGPRQSERLLLQSAVCFLLFKPNALRIALQQVTSGVVFHLVLRLP